LVVNAGNQKDSGLVGIEKLNKPSGRGTSWGVSSCGGGNLTLKLRKKNSQGKKEKSGDLAVAIPRTKGTKKEKLI